MKPTSGAPLHTHHHAVKFYGTEQSLFTTVASFLGEGLASGQPAIVIATEVHRAAIIEHLCGRVIDCEQAKRDGDLVLLDADETLGLFMVDGSPDPVLFESNVGAFIGQVLSGRGKTIVRAYGEMVDVLWKQGNAQGAIRLEMLWNTLAVKHGFALLCSYAMGSFYKQAKLLEDVIAQHTIVVESDSKVVQFPTARARRTA